jgi:hypothetical protein
MRHQSVINPARCPGNQRHLKLSRAAYVTSTERAAMSSECGRFADNAQPIGPQSAPIQHQYTAQNAGSGFFLIVSRETILKIS